jgi:uncharacterized protein
LRNPRNDTVDAEDSVDPGRDASERTCILTRRKGSRDQLIRLALGADGQVHPDVRAKAPGRGAWIGVARPALGTAVAKGKLKNALTRAFKTREIIVPDDLCTRIEEALSRAALERLGLEARASTLATGSERIEEAARKGALHLLLHAADASADGNRKLDQAWRVGSGLEGSGRHGLTLSVPRTILSVALGRENVVHIGMIDARAAGRVAATIDRWHGFIGLEPTGWPCADTAQGSGPRGAFVNVEGSGFTE